MNPIFQQCPHQTTMLSSEEIFNDFVTSYQDALDKSGCKHKLKYQGKMNTTSNKKKKTTKSIIWFNPPYSKKVKINTGKIFLSLIKKRFPPHHKFYKLFTLGCLINEGDTKHLCLFFHSLPILMDFFETPSPCLKLTKISNPPPPLPSSLFVRHLRVTRI